MEKGTHCNIRFIIVYVAFIFSSCGIDWYSLMYNGSEKVEKANHSIDKRVKSKISKVNGSPTYHSGGRLYESYIEDAIVPEGYKALVQPNCTSTLTAKTGNWNLQLNSQRVINNEVFLTYSIENQSDGLFFDSLISSKAVSVVVSKDSLLDCIIKNLRVIKQNVKTRQPVAMVFVLDLSGSMGQYRAELMQSELDSALGFKRPDDELFFVKYDDRVQCYSRSHHIDTLRKELRPNLGLGSFGGATALFDALHFSIDSLLNTKLIDKQIFIITDGCENSSQYVTNINDIIATARKYGININTIGFGSYVDEFLLKEISLMTGGRYRHFNQTEEFKYIFDHIYFALNNNYLVNFKPCLFGENLGLKTSFVLSGDTLGSATWIRSDLKIGDVVELNVLFDKDKSAIKSEFEADLLKFALFLKANPQIQVELGGHTDSDGDESYNVKLSERRAESIKNFLVNQGVASIRLSVVGNGSSQPKYPNISNENMQLNRRTEAKIVAFLN